MGLALAMRNRGWAWEDFHAALSDPQNLMGRYYTHRRSGAPRTSHDVAARLQRDWAKACSIISNNPALTNRQEAKQELALDYAVLKDEVWSGRTAVTDRIVLSALYEMAIKKGQRELPLATRTVAERSGVSQKCARVALTRLRDAGHILLTRASEGGNAAEYRLVRRRCAEDSSTSRGGPPRGGESPAHSLVSLAASNLFRWMGRYGAMVFHAIQRGARTVTEIVESSGVSRRTAFKYLGLLLKTGLVSRNAWGLRADDLENLEQAAQTVGVVRDYAAEQRLAHRTQRRGWRQINTRVCRARRWLKVRRT
jgi:DNA-binding IscR family transcriptional regulator